ncbi:alpha/beta fold hydrolase [Agromyces italicus]|uniref:alpha/beta fold hydrolase n=1 Tax=Agromyces italicus TaxID=279572 RepID=UPI0003B3335B|nr:alpha/beta fold hydrolase [Agromyces italicus]
MPTLELPGAELHYETAGPISAPALLLIPAGIATLRMWDDLVDRLAARHFVVRYDPRGFGGTRHDFTVPFANHDDAIAVLDHLGVARATVVGASRGGALAIDIALAASDRVNGLITISARIGGFPDVALAPDEQARLDEVDALDPLADPAGYIRLETTVFAVGTGRGEADLDPAFLARAHELATPNIAHVADDGEQVPLEPPAAERLREIGVPTFAIVGDHDLTPFRVQFDAIVSAAPQATGLRIAGAAHLPSVERPGEVGAAVLAWLDERGL